MLTPASIHDAYSDGTAANVARRRAPFTSDDYARVPSDMRELFVETQFTASRILAHGAQDRAELDTLARMCAVPRTVLAFDVEEVAR